MWIFIARVASVVVALGAVNGRLVRELPEFAVRFYRTFGQDPSNIIVSPYSLCSSLTQTAVLAGGQTADELLTVLGLKSLPLTELLAAIDNLNIALRKDIFHGIAYLDPAVIFANGSGMILLKSISQLGPPQHLMEIMQGGTPLTPVAIHRYIEQRTNSNIHIQVFPDHLGANILLLVNAMVVYAEWKEQFYREKTYRHRFMSLKPASYPDIWVDMMTDVRIVQWKRDNRLYVDVVEVPLRGGDLVFIMVLPHDTHGLPLVEKAILENTDALTSLCQGLAPNLVRLGIPRFRLHTSLHLKDGLRGMGIVRAFDPGRADFSNVSRITKFHLSDIIHAAAIDVNEEGISSLPVAPLLYGNPSGVIPPDHSFVADHPFIFFVKHKPVNRVLIIGKYVGP